MKNRIASFFATASIGGLLSFVLALIISGLMQSVASTACLAPKEAMRKNISGLPHFKSQAGISTITPNELITYDQRHGTMLYEVMAMTPGVANKQELTGPDFVQLQQTLDSRFVLPLKEAKEEKDKSLILYILGLIFAPIWASFMSNLTKDYIYPFVTDKVGGLFARLWRFLRCEAA